MTRKSSAVQIVTPDDKFQKQELLASPITRRCCMFYTGTWRRSTNRSCRFKLNAGIRKRCSWQVQDRPNRQRLTNLLLSMRMQVLAQEHAKSCPGWIKQRPQNFHRFPEPLTGGCAPCFSTRWWILKRFRMRGRTSRAALSFSKKGSSRGRRLSLHSSGDPNQLLIGMPLSTCRAKAWGLLSMITVRLKSQCKTLKSLT